jgi:3-hydroxyacyl-CoA dehydrogenase/enoyl-CoA hydratase/carnithine racemase
MLAAGGPCAVADTQFVVRPVETQAGTLALVTIDNGEEARPTVLGRIAFQSAARALDELEQGDYAAAVFTGKPSVFVAGADMKEFPRATAEVARAGSRIGHTLFARIAALPYPTVAAINGICLGGGVELALHCDARTISTDVRHFACPECFLGLFPAWGGTQLVPRLVGAETAVTVIVENPMRQNRMLNGQQAHELGFADRLLDPAEFVENSVAYAVELVELGTDRRHADLADATEVVRKARARLDGQVHGAAPAPYVALDLIEGAATWALDEGYRREEEAIAELLPGPEAQNSIYAFDLVERRAKRGVGVPKVEPRAVRKVGIVGAGLMASQITTLFVRRLEVPVVLRDLDEAIVGNALEYVRGELAGAAARGRMTEDKARALGETVSGGTTYEGFEDCDVVLEAVVEQLPVKQQVFAELREVMQPHALLMTNTSSLSVRAMGADVGLHFFNPVALMPLVELVRHSETADVALATAWEISEKLGKRGVVVADTPGFVVNRILTRMTRVLFDALEHGNTIDETDEAILRLGFPIAPSVLLQMVGAKVANHVLETMHEAFPDRFPLSQTLANYARGSDEIVVAEHAPKRVEAITEAVLEAVADEIHHMLEEGVVAEAADIDTCLLLGAGWPFWLGGITPHLDRSGISERLFGRRLAA